ncbi:MAG: hypothetical protein QHG99_02785 [Methanomicrobiales archaeon]|nr:hypothetical protein [Methanomicrobiales archaeon]
MPLKRFQGGVRVKDDENHRRYLPMSMGEADRAGHGKFDIVLVSGDACVDHPLFCTSMIGRLIAQPDWRSGRDITAPGRRELFFAVTSDDVDSMLDHHTPSVKRRKKDVYSAVGRC